MSSSVAKQLCVAAQLKPGQVSVLCHGLLDAPATSSTFSCAVAGFVQLDVYVTVFVPWQS